MKILSLETSAKACSAAVTDDGAVLASAFQNAGLTHSRSLMPMVEAMLKNASLTLADMDAVAVARGPGSFTGIRIGVAAAKGLAFAGEKPVIGVSTLEAMAQQCACLGGRIVCAMDARRGQIYNAVFRAEDSVLTRLSEDRAIALPELTAELAGSDEPITVVGDGAALCLQALEAAGLPCRPAPPQLIAQSAVGVGLTAQRLSADPAELLSAQALTPFYLRPPQAQTLRERLGQG